jgi:hypothetical protein
MAGWISRLDLARELGLSVDWLEKQESTKRANGKGRK